MSRSNVKRPVKSIDYGTKAYLHNDYRSMIDTTPNKGVYDRVTEPHSIFEQPYVDLTEDYVPMQEFHRSNYKIAYRDVEFTFSPLGFADPCAGNTTVHATLDGNISAYHTVDCGTSHVIGMDGGVPPFELGGIAGVLKGDVTGNIYTAPPCGECSGDVSDHIQVLDECGRSPNLIIKTRFPQNMVWILDRTEIESCGLRDTPVGDGYCDEVIGDTLIRKHYSLCGSIGASTCVASCTPPHCDCPLITGTIAPCANAGQCTAPLTICWWALYMTEYYIQECI